MTDERIKTIIEHYGYARQLDKLVEESAELIVAIKHKDTEMHPGLSASEQRGNFLNFLEELADVKIMVSQVEYFLETKNPDAFEQYKQNIEFKLNREIKRIKTQQENALK